MAMKRLLPLIAGLFLASSVYGAVPSFQTVTNIVDAKIAGLLGPTNGVTALTATNIAAGEAAAATNVANLGNTFLLRIDNGKGLTNLFQVAAHVVHPDGNSTDFTSTDSALGRGQAFTNACRMATNRDVIYLLPNASYEVPTMWGATNGVTFFGNGANIWRTNADIDPNSSPFCLPQNNQRYFSLSISNMPATNDGPTFSLAFGNHLTDPASTNVYLEDCNIWGVTDTIQANTTAGACSWTFKNCLLSTRFDMFGANTQGQTNGGFLFDRCLFLGTNILPTATSLTLISSAGQPLTFRNCRFNASTKQITNIMAAIPVCIVAGHASTRIFIENYVSDTWSTNVFTGQGPNSDVTVTGMLDIETQATAIVTNFFINNYTRADGKPLNTFIANGAGFEKTDNNTVRMAYYETNGATTAITGKVLMQRGLAAKYRITVMQYCTTAGNAVALHTTVTYTDSDEVDHAIAPAPDINLDSTSNSSQGSMVVETGLCDPGTATTFNILLNTTLGGAIGTGQYRVVVDIEQIGSN